jgi:hypothetical protein
VNESSKQVEVPEQTSTIDENYDTVPERWGGTWEAYIELRRQFDVHYDKLLPSLAAYQGRFIAISPDGAEVLDHDADSGVLRQRLKERGARPDLLVLEYVPRPEEETSWGGSGWQELPLRPGQPMEEVAAAQRAATEARRQLYQIQAYSQPPLSPEDLIVPARWGGTWEAYYELRRRFADNYTRLLPSLGAYAGQFVCLSPDGAQVLDSDVNAVTLWSRLKEQGERPDLLVIEYVPRPEEVGWF